MKKIAFLFAFFTFIVGFGAAYSEETIAVLDFVLADGVEPGYAESLSDQVRIEVLKRDDLVLLDRQSIEAIIDEQKLQSSGLLSEDTAVKIGEIAGASLIVNGSVSQTSGKYVISLRLIDVETSEILKVLSETVKISAPPLQKAVTEMSQEMFGTSDVLSRGQIVARSALLPGLGQGAAGNRKKAILYGATFGALSLSTGILGYLSYDSYKTYQETEGYGVDYDSLWNKARGIRISFIAAASVTGAFYLFNIVDAGFLTGGGSRDE